MKLLFILFACISLNNAPEPSQKEEKKKTTVVKKEKKASVNLAPSILINF